MHSILNVTKRVYNTLRLNSFNFNKCLQCELPFYVENSLLNKLDFVKLMIMKFDILAVSETKLDNDIADVELCITEYNLVRLDRNCGGGAVLFYCQEKYSIELCNYVNSIMISLNRYGKQDESDVENFDFPAF